MKHETISEAVKFLETAFDALNDKFFAAKLARPMITIQSTPKAYGHFTTYDAWVGSEARKEINIGAETLNRPIENVVATLVHEMVHYHCLVNEIKDTSRGGTYHNKRFKTEAESHGLTITHDPKIGWSVTQPDEALLAFTKAKKWDEIKFARNTPKNIGATAKKSSTRKYTCPCCGQSIRATKSVNIICGDCMVKMETEETDD